MNIDGFQCQLTVLLPEGKCAMKRQLYSGPTVLRVTLLLLMQHFLPYILHTAALNTHPDFCYLEVKPRPTIEHCGMSVSKEYTVALNCCVAKALPVKYVHALDHITAHWL